MDLFLIYYRVILCLKLNSNEMRGYFQLKRSVVSLVVIVMTSEA